jgi:hypothetical protein
MSWQKFQLRRSNTRRAWGGKMEVSTTEYGKSHEVAKSRLLLGKTMSHNRFQSLMQKQIQQKWHTVDK